MKMRIEYDSIWLAFSVPNPLPFTLMSLELNLGNPYYNDEESPLLYAKISNSIMPRLDAGLYST